MADLVHEDTSQRLRGMGYKPVGGPFDPNQTATTIALPASMFSSVILVPMLICREQRAQRHFIMTLIIPQYAMYVACLAVQCTFLFYVRTLVSEKERPVCKEGGDATLRLLCMTLSVAAVLKDIAETFSMHAWLSCLPKWTQEQHVILEYTCENSGLTDFPMQKYKNGDDTELVKPAVGITNRTRLLIYVCVLLVKLVMACVLLIYGTAFVGSASSDGDLILNAVAMSFILDIDDLLYELMTPRLYKTWVETCSVISFDEDEVRDSTLYWPYLAFVVIGGATGVMYGFWC